MSLDQNKKTRDRVTSAMCNFKMPARVFNMVSMYESIYNAPLLQPKQSRVESAVSYMAYDRFPV